MIFQLVICLSLASFHHLYLQIIQKKILMILTIDISKIHKFWIMELYILENGILQLFLLDISINK